MGTDTAGAIAGSAASIFGATLEFYFGHLTKNAYGNMKGNIQQWQWNSAGISR